MDTSRLPLDVKSFLIDQIDSVANLELLLMLFNNRSREWNAEGVSKEMRSNTHSAANQLEQLFVKGFLTVSSSKFYQYKPTQDLDEKVSRLAEVYKEMPVAVVTCIYEKPSDKLKGFANAFKFKKD